MVSVALVLFVLTEYDSPALAGIVTFASIFPGLLVAPIAGALLDRHGRVRLIILDYVVALASMVLIGVLALEDALPPDAARAHHCGRVADQHPQPHRHAQPPADDRAGAPLGTGQRHRLERLCRRHDPRATDRGHAGDRRGRSVALIVIGVTYGLAAVTLIGAPDPPSLSDSTGRLFRDAWDGVEYTWANPTLRGLGFSISALNIAGGMITIVIPLIVIERLQAGEALVGVIFAISGVTGMASALWFGRQDTRGREWPLLVIPMFLVGPILAVLLVAAGAADPAVGFIAAAVSMGGYGLVQGPLDIALFTVRQRRTDVAWMGRAFAVSMAFNFLGYPTGAAIAGVLAATSIEASIIVGVAAAVLAAGLAATMIPKQDEAAASATVPTASR